MRRQTYLLAAIFLLSIIGLAGCNQANSATVAPAAGSQLATISTPDPAAYRAKLDEARSALEKGDFETAKNLAQEAARLNPADNTAWSVFEEAALKQSADACPTAVIASTPNISWLTRSTASNSSSWMCVNRTNTKPVTLMMPSTFPCVKSLKTWINYPTANRTLFWSTAIPKSGPPTLW